MEFHFLIVVFLIRRVYFFKEKHFKVKVNDQNANKKFRIMYRLYNINLTLTYIMIKKFYMKILR